MSERDEGQLQGEYKPSEDSMYKRKNQISTATEGYLHDVLLKFAEDRPLAMPGWLDRFDRDYGEGRGRGSGRDMIGHDSSLQALFDKARKGEFLNEDGEIDHGKLDDVFGSWLYEKIPQTEDLLIDKLKRIGDIDERWW